MQLDLPADDFAPLASAPDMQLAVSCDMLVEGRHFFAGADPERLGHKALAVNLSDLAARGERPLAFTLSLPNVQEAWLAGFARGLLGYFGHILRASNVGACIDTSKTITLIAVCAYPTSAGGRFCSGLLHRCTLAGGDD